MEERQRRDDLLPEPHHRATTPGRGSIFTYKFNPNGKYEFVGYIKTTMYNGAPTARVSSDLNCRRL